MSIIYLNGSLIEDAAIFTFQDRLRLGDGVFETMLIVYEGTDLILLRIKDHIKRLLKNAKTLEIGNLPREKELYEETRNFISRSNLSEGRFALNILITRGVAERGLMPAKNSVPSISMRLAKIPDRFPPIKAIIAQNTRRNEGSPLSQIKSCNYGDNILALLEAQAKNANEAILLNNAGNVTCASAGNIFAEINGQLITPPLTDGVMNGITRGLVIKKYAAIERSISEGELETANGIYITNSIKGVQPIAALNGKTLPEPSIKISQEKLL